MRKTKAVKRKKQKAESKRSKSKPVSVPFPQPARQGMSPVRALEILAGVIKTNTAYTFNGPDLAREAYGVFDVMHIEWKALRLAAATAADAAQVKDKKGKGTGT